MIGWFDSNPPLSGYGTKLAESYLIKGNFSKVANFEKEGWINASLKVLKILNT